MEQNNETENNQENTPDESEPKEVTLRKPLQVNGKEVTLLTFRDPVAEDYVKAGYPVDIGSGSATPNVDSVMKLTSRLTKTPIACLEKMSGYDLNQCVGVCMSFFE